MNKVNTETLAKVARSGWLRAALLALLLVWLAQVVAQTFWLWWGGPADRVSLTPDLVVLGASQAAQQSSIDATVAERWALFGRAEVNGEAGSLVESGEEEGKDAPETRLKLQLLGVFAHLDSVLAGAIIQEKGKDAQLYHPGDDLPGRAKLYKVYADRVLLKRMGAIESLSFDKTALAGTISAVSDGDNDHDDNASTDGSEDNVAKQRQLVISQLALSPVAEGSNAGYEVTDGISADIQQAVGLKPGDKILTVNGLSLGTEEADQQAIASFYESGQAQVEVQRGNSRLTLTYPP